MINESPVEMKPCPFCGSKSVEISNPLTVNNTKLFNVRCLTCGASSGGLTSRCPSAAENWNLRVTPAYEQPKPADVAARASPFGIGKYPPGTPLSTQCGAFLMDQAGLWHFENYQAGTVSEAARDAVANRPRNRDASPSPAWFWFDETPAPMFRDDTADALVLRWEAWRFDYQTGNGRLLLRRLLMLSGRWSMMSESS